ncbi:MAG: PEP-CTERM sorting domain-containing protein, partial [Planctomycetota bacterium]|nr:PEP-CTERM sorting domain-containing protein [Planctomycetota bacterium]
DFFFRNTENSNTVWQNVATLDVTIGATTVTISGDTTVNNYDTKFSLSGTSLEGVSTSAVTLDNFSLVNSTANEAFFVSEVEFFAAPASAVPEPATLAIWGLMGVAAGAFGLRRKIRLRS